MNANAKVADNILDAINDKFLQTHSRNLTAGLLKQGMDINKVVAIIKEYTIKYMFIKSQDKEMALLFTPETWWDCRGRK